MKTGLLLAVTCASFAAASCSSGDDVPFGGLPNAGTFVVTIEAAEGTSPDVVADRLDQLLDSYSGATSAEVNGRRVTATVSNFPDADVDTFQFTMRSEASVTVRAALSCAAIGAEPTTAIDDDVDIVTHRDGSTCALLPSRLDRSPFLGASIEENDFGSSIVVTIDPELQDDFNAVVADCFAATPSCPSQMLAIVADDEIISAPVVNTPRFDESIQISGNFSLSEQRDLADAIVRDRFLGEFSDAEYAYQPNG